MKKYLSCVILIIACVVCAMVFYVGAREPSDDEEGAQLESSSQEQASSESSSESEVTKNVSLNESGTILSEYFCPARLRVEWSTLKYEGESKLYINAELYLDSDEGISRECNGSLIVNGQESTFTVKPSKEKSTLLQASSIEIADFSDGSVIRISGNIGLDFQGQGGVNLSSLNVEGKIYQSEISMSSSHLISLEHISQYPNLPSGDEITSLAMVLRYLKYNVNECDLCDLYLDKGPVGFTDFYKANAGNPRDTYNSYGCLAPVIVNSAQKFIDANGGSHTPVDYTGYNARELYRQVSLGTPVIVWLCDDFENTPSISRIWVVDGKTLYLKSNMACMVLVGYDYTKGTVTLANPAGNIFSIGMTSFEKSFADMGSFAVAVK